jgi:hypothetical protein
MRAIHGAIAGLLLFGCTSNTNTKNRAAIQEADGAYSFYAGRGVGDALMKGEAVDDKFPAAFMRLKVPGNVFADAMNGPKRLKTISFEEANPEIEATVHQYVMTPDLSAGKTLSVLETLRFHPGDPWVSGYGQFGINPDNDTVLGLFEIIQWVKDPTGAMPTVMAQHIHSTGLMADENMPALKYADANMLNAALPDSWK